MSVLVTPPPPPLLRRWADACLDLIFPPACAACGKAGHRICPTCAQAVVPVPHTICEHCGRVQAARVPRCDFCLGASPLRQVRAAGLHVAPLRHFIHLLKYDDRPDLAPDLARYLAANLAGPEWTAIWPQLDAIAPVPLHPARRAQRGYDQAELLAQGLSSRTNIPLRLDLVTRTRQTRAQVGLNAAQRQANMQGAFAAAGPCAGQHVLLIDDVYTTGATMAACAGALLAAGAASVSGLTLALPDHGADHWADYSPSNPTQNATP
jgi:ComF family protein